MIQWLNNLTWQDLGLASFVITITGTVAILLYDWWLYLTDQTMITDYCRENPWLAWVLLTVIQLGVLGLAVHFMAQVKLDPDSIRR